MEHSIAFHYPCMDGIFAAYIARKAILAKDSEAKINLIPITHGKEYKLPKHGHLVCLDVTPKFNMINWGIESLTVLDHHESAQEDIDTLKGNPNDHIVFNMNRSGALLAWCYYTFDNDLLFELIRYVDDRDRWVKKLPDTEEVSAGLFQLVKTNQSHEEAFKNIDDLLANHTLQSIIAVGSPIVKFQRAVIKYAIARCTFATMVVADRTYKVGFYEARYLRSDIAASILETHPHLDFAFCWSYFKGKIQLALRSNNSHIDVLEVAKQLGGGGHRNAAGCEFDVPFSRYFVDISPESEPVNFPDDEKNNMVDPIKKFDATLITDPGADFEHKNEIKIVNECDIRYIKSLDDECTYVLKYDIRDDKLLLFTPDMGSHVCTIASKDPFVLHTYSDFS